MKSIPENFIDLTENQKKAFAFLATIMPDGSPQVTPVWFNMAGEYILINSALGRVKDRNMRARPSVSLCISDPSNPYRYLQILGTVVEITHQGADEHIDALARKYLNQDKYPYRQSGEQRVRYKIQINKVNTKE